MAYGTNHSGAGNDDFDFHDVRCAQAISSMFAGIKILYYLRGMDFAAFLINMLEHIIVDIRDFLVVLLIIIITYSCETFTFHFHRVRPLFRCTTNSSEMTDIVRICMRALTQWLLR